VPVILVSPTVAVTLSGLVPEDESVAENIRLNIRTGYSKGDGAARSGDGAVADYRPVRLGQRELDAKCASLLRSASVSIPVTCGAGLAIQRPVGAGP
jgi:hypothetical protein